MQIGGTSVNNLNFFSTILLELLDNQDIFIESNIIYLKIFTFQNMLYGIPIKLLKYHNVAINIYGLNKFIHYKYSIDVIYSGKNLFSIDIKPEHLEEIKQIIIQSKDNILNQIQSGKKYNCNFNVFSS